jgi:Cytochrome P450
VPGVAAGGTAAFGELAASLREVIARGDSLLAEVTGPLAEEEAISNAAVLMFGGIETTEGMIANALLHLLSSPAQLALVLADPGLVPARSRSRCGSSRPPRSSTGTRPSARGSAAPTSRPVTR